MQKAILEKLADCFGSRPTSFNTHMKKLLLTLMIGFAVCLSALAGNGRIEGGSFTSRTGVRFSAAYLVLHNHYVNVHLVSLMEQQTNG
jgi:hypothetical protein